ncbi:diaminopimelate epimerase [Metallumcola ferriviriculae]|uniref:Diaminopimelate epimerase n=1 Tax=Metallumcola ferriviriculae TaxID=3039180 RepID=A0AAU0UMC5_9FIRM|nr:diaminopimelate epimerase [Desulfitibacteraceae bacterium MK1]
MDFIKMHGLGNDFIMVNDMDENIAEGRLPELATKLCDRKFGIGADGLVLMLPSTQADVRMRIFNPDGSEPEMCGNAIRCFAKLAWEEGTVKKEALTVETLAGIIKPRLLLKGSDIEAVRVDMGEPRLERGEIPMSGTGTSPVAGETINLADGKNFQFTAVSMGNPHCIIFVDDMNTVQLKNWGAELEKHPLFPKKTNVEFVEVVNDSHVKMRVWERGAGETLACGTGACATGVAAALNKHTGRKVTVSLTGGDLVIEWDDKTNHVYMTGPAAKVFTGRVEIKEEI